MEGISRRLSLRFYQDGTRQEWLLAPRTRTPPDRSGRSFLWGTERQQVSPIVYPKMVPIFPFNIKGVVAHQRHISDHARTRVDQRDLKNVRIRVFPHIFVTSAAFGTWAGIAQQAEGIKTGLPVAPIDPQLFGGPVCSDICRSKFIHNVFLSSTMLGDRGYSASSGILNDCQIGGDGPASPVLIKRGNEIPPGEVI